MTRSEAILYIEQRLRETNLIEKTDLVIDHKNVTEISTHWIIAYQSKRYIITGDERHAIAGNSPFAVDKITGQVDPSIDTSWMCMEVTPASIS